MNNIGFFAVMFIVGVFFIWKGSMKISSKTEAWPKSKKTGRIIGVFLLIPFIISLIITTTGGGKSSHTYRTLESGASYSNQQYGFKITPPTGWSVDESASRGAIVAFVDRTNNAQGIISISLVNQPEVNASNFDSYIDAGVQQVKSFPGGVVISNNKLSSSSRPSYLTETKMAISRDGSLSHLLQLSVLARDGQTYVVSGMSIDDSQWSLFKDLITNSINSFSIN